jgi:hypothetical protein
MKANPEHAAAQDSVEKPADCGPCIEAKLSETKQETHVTITSSSGL